MGFKTRWPPRQQTREEGTLLPFHGLFIGLPWCPDYDYEEIMNGRGRPPPLE